MTEGLNKEKRKQTTMYEGVWGKKTVRVYCNNLFLINRNQDQFEYILIPE